MCHREGENDKRDQARSGDAASSPHLQPPTIASSDPSESELTRLMVVDITERKRAEEARRASEELLRAVIDSSPDAIYVKDRDSRWLMANPVVLRIVRRTAEEAIGKTDLELYEDPEIGRAIIENDHSILQSGNPEAFEEVADTPDGRRTFLSVKAPRRDAAGNIIGIIGISRDITERKRAERELAESRTKYQNLIETTGDFIWELDSEGRFTYCSPQSKTLWGIEPSEMIGKKPSDAMPEETKVVFAEQFAEARRSPRAYVGLETRSYDSQGRIVYLEINGVPFFDDAGNLLGFRGSSRDITKRKQDEDALRQAKDELEQRVEERTAELARANAYNRGLIEVSLDPLVTIGSDGRITDVNAGTEAVTGLRRTELIGTDFSEYFTEPDRAKAGYQQAFRERVVRNYPLEIRHRDGHTTPVLYNATVYRTAEGKVAGVFAAARDITERQQTEQELRQAHEDLATRASQLRALAGKLTLSERRERSRLAKILHDHLQQLLVAAKFRTAALGRGGDQSVRLATKEVETLIDESIAASRSLTAELSPPILHEAGLNAGLQWLARRMTDQQGLFVELEVEEDGDLPEDIKVLLFESVRELLFNVVKHAQIRSATVNVRRVGDHLQVTVSDQGGGFDPTAISLAGEKGRGFGLFNIRERLEFMGGTLEIESKPGRGSRFVLSVPVAVPAANETKLQTMPMLPETHLVELQSVDLGQKIRVMLADDHAIVRQGIANLLADEPDMEVVGEAADGQEAVELAARLLPDIILMDVSMPKLNGVEATRVIHDEFPEIRIIGLSMFEDTERAQAMRDAGAVSYVTKSGQASVLVDSIRTSIQAKDKVRIPASA